MASNTRWPEGILQKKGFVEVNGKFVPINSVTPKKVDKIPTMLERAIKQDSTEKVFSKPVNKKVRNATKVEQDGVKFDSRLELYFYNALKAAGIAFEFQKEFLLQDKFRYGTQAIRPLKIIIDFVLPNYLIDTKGWQTYDGKIKHKLLKWHLHQQGLTPEIVMPKNRKECDALINRIRYGKA